METLSAVLLGHTSGFIKEVLAHTLFKFFDIDIYMAVIVFGLLN